MCLIFLSVNQHPGYKLIIAGNRDEFHARPTAPADYWSEAPGLLAGRDLEAMGTWLGVSRRGRVSLLTNFRDPHNINPAAPSRGHLVSDFLLSQETGKEYLDKVSARGPIYNGFNLVAGMADELWYYSNYSNAVTAVQPGFHGLSNALLNTPWPKVERGKSLLLPAMSGETIDPEELFELLYDDTPAPDEQLPDTGVGLERERVLSSMFIKSPNYGSRCSTVLSVDRDNHVHFSERVYDLVNFTHVTRHFEFNIE
jgi:uncharacterized protein with NRDE domain